MIIDSNKTASMADANRNFSEIAREAEEKGYLVIFKHNRPKFILMDVNSLNLKLYMSDEYPDKIAKKKLSLEDWL